MLRYRMINHTADIGMEFFGRTKEELFASAGEGLFDALCDLSEVRRKESFNIDVEGVDEEDLLIQWLRELLYLHNVKGMLLAGFDEVKLKDNRLTAKVSGEKMRPRKHQIKGEIKAVTYHDLLVKKNDRWTARVIFDV